MRKLPFRPTPFGVLLVVGTLIAAVIAVVSNAAVAYLVLVSFVVAWALVALRATSPNYRAAHFGEDPAAGAEKRWKLD